MSKNNEQLNLNNSLFGTGDFVTAPPPNPSVEIFEKVTEEMFSTKNIELKTEVNDKQIMAFSIARSFAKKYKVPLLSELIRNLSKYSISKDRKGRKGYIEVAKANLQMAGTEEREPRSIPDRILGRG